MSWKANITFNDGLEKEQTWKSFNVALRDLKIYMHAYYSKPVRIILDDLDPGPPPKLPDEIQSELDYMDEMLNRRIEDENS